MLTTFVDKYNVAVEVAKVDPTKVSTVISNGNHNDYIKETSLQREKPGSMDYYAVVMTTMIALYRDGARVL